MSTDKPFKKASKFPDEQPETYASNNSADTTNDVNEKNSANGVRPREDKTEFRQFWIGSPEAPLKENKKPYEFWQTTITDRADEQQEIAPNVHVIEYSAYLEMKEAFDQTFADYQDIGRELSLAMEKLEHEETSRKGAWLIIEGLNKQISKLKSDLTIRALDEERE